MLHFCMSLIRGSSESVVCILGFELCRRLCVGVCLNSAGRVCVRILSGLVLTVLDRASALLVPLLAHLLDHATGVLSPWMLRWLSSWV